MNATLEIKDIKTTIEVENGDTPIGDKTIIFKDGTSYVVLELSSANYTDLGNKLFPKGLMPDTFADKLDMLNDLLEELSPVRDKENPDWRISKAEYNRDLDEIYYESEEV